MKKYCLYGLMLLVGFCISCQDDSLNPTELSYPIELYLDKSEDTLLLLANKEFRMDVYGVFIEESEQTIRNSGVIADTSYIIHTVDTTVERMNRKDLDWYSSRSSIATVDNGIVTGISAGQTLVWAETNGVNSDSIVVVVSTPELPPELILDPPLYRLVFQDSANVSGRVMVGQHVVITVGGDTTTEDEMGYFNHWVYLQEGSNVIPVTAKNTGNGLSTTKYKTNVYFSFENSGIVGHWSGTSLTRPFSFDIYEAFGVYVIDGTLTVDVTMIGGPMIVEDIIIVGLIHPDGTIDAEVSKEGGEFTVSGYLDGYFSDAGHAQGKYGIEISKPGWPSATASARWEAEKDN